MHTEYSGLELPEARLTDLVRAQVRCADPYVMFVFFRLVEQDADFDLVHVTNEIAQSDKGESENRDDSVEAEGLVHGAGQDLTLSVRYCSHVCEIQVALADITEMVRYSNALYKLKKAKCVGDIFETEFHTHAKVRGKWFTSPQLKRASLAAFALARKKDESEGGTALSNQAKARPGVPARSDLRQTKSEVHPQSRTLGWSSN